MRVGSADAGELEDAYAALKTARRALYYYVEELEIAAGGTTRTMTHARRF